MNPITNIVCTHDQYKPNVQHDESLTNEEEVDEAQEGSEVEDEETSTEADDLFADDVVRLLYPKKFNLP